MARTTARWTATLLALAVALYLFGLWRAPELPDRAPDFALPAIDGSAVRLSDLRGRTVVLNFWAPWCAPCRLEIPAFSRFARRHPEVTVLGIAAPGEEAEIRSAATELEVAYPVLLADDRTLAAYGVTTFPTTVVVDPDGRVVTSHTGLMLDPQLAWATSTW